MPTKEGTLILSLITLRQEYKIRIFFKLPAPSFFLEPFNSINSYSYLGRNLNFFIIMLSHLGTTSRVTIDVYSTRVTKEINRSDHDPCRYPPQMSFTLIRLHIFTYTSQSKHLLFSLLNAFHTVLVLQIRI